MSSLHPLIRILCFLVFSACLAFGDYMELLCGGMLLAGMYLVFFTRHLRPAWTMIFRLRWFLLSLLIVYGWFTPGQPLWTAGSQLEWLLPTRAGLTSGLLRMALLAVIVMGANLLLRTTSREQILLAVYELARPLALLGVPRERLAVRMMLVIEALGPVREIVADRLATARGTVRNLRAAGQFASDVMTDVMQRAERESGDTIRVPQAERPPLGQWACPVLLWGLFFATSRLAQYLS